jgi:hypothetical protein
MARGNAQIRKRIRRPEKLDGVPHEGLVGAHTSKREPGPHDVDEDGGAEPLGPGADVAPTSRAVTLERARHQLERDLGRVPAGEEGALRERRAPDVTRAMLDDARHEAERLVTGHGWHERT